MGFRLRREDLLEDSRDHLILTTAERSLKIYDWAPDAMIVPRGGGTRRWDRDWAPYFRDSLDIVRARTIGIPTAPDLDDHLVEELDIITGAQIAKTFGYLTPALAWTAALYPRDIGLVLPNDDVKKAFVRDKLRKTFDHSPRLQQLLPQGTSVQERRLGTDAWLLDDLTLHFLNGNLANDLRSRDLDRLFGDELGQLKPDCQGQGSPISLMRERQKTYPDTRFRTGVSTPLLLGDIPWSLLCGSTHERLLLACLQCLAHDWLNPDRIESTRTTATAMEIYVDDAATWRCKYCGRKHTSDERTQMIAAACAIPHRITEAGGWVPGDYAIDHDGKASWTPRATFHENGRLKTWQRPSGIKRSKWLNSAYSRVVTFGYFLSESIKADKGTVEVKQSFTNNMRAEPWNPQPDAATTADVARTQVLDDSSYQRGQLPKTVPPGGRILLTTDQQGNQRDTSWFPWVARYWLDDGRSWQIDAGTVTKEEGWDGLNLLEKKVWAIAGQVLGIKATIIDTANGNMFRDIRTWAAQNKTKRFAMAGSGSMGPDLPYSEQRVNLLNMQKMFGLEVAYYYNSNMFRDEVYASLIGADGVPAWYLPGNADEDYTKSLTSEMRIPQNQLIRGKMINRLIWVPRTFQVMHDGVAKTHTRRDTHWWDCEVMQMAAVFILKWIKRTVGQQKQTPAISHTVSSTSDWMSGFNQ